MRINNNYSGSITNDSKKSTQLKFKEQIGVFEDKVRDRIENGEPAYTMGRTSMTEQDWENLMDNIDSYMEKARKLNEANQEKEESLEKKFYDRIMVITQEK